MVYTWNGEIQDYKLRKYEDVLIEDDYLLLTIPDIEDRFIVEIEV